MQQADRFLYSLVVSAGQHDGQFVLKQEYMREVDDKWLCSMANID